MICPAGKGSTCAVLQETSWILLGMIREFGSPFSLSASTELMPSWFMATDLLGGDAEAFGARVRAQTPPSGPSRQRTQEWHSQRGVRGVRMPIGEFLTIRHPCRHRRCLAVPEKMSGTCGTRGLGAREAPAHPLGFTMQGISQLPAQRENPLETPRLAPRGFLGAAVAELGEKIFAERLLHKSPATCLGFKQAK